MTRTCKHPSRKHLQKYFKTFRDNWKRIYEELEKLRRRIINSKAEPTYGLHRKKQMPFFRSFKREIFGENEVDEDEISLLVDLTQRVFSGSRAGVEAHRILGKHIPARNKLKAEIQKTLLDPSFIKLPNLITNRAKIISRVMEIAEKNNDIILYAE